jgi:hypothetical protein
MLQLIFAARVRSAKTVSAGLHGLGFVWPRSRKSDGAARVRSAALYSGNRNASGSFGQSTPTRSAGCGRKGARSAATPYLSPRKDQVDDKDQLDEGSEPGSDAGPEHRSAARSRHRPPCHRSAAEPNPKALPARHNLGRLRPLRAQIQHQMPRWRVCAARGHGLRNGRAPRRAQALPHPGAARKGDRRARGAPAPHPFAHRRCGRPSRNVPCRPPAPRWHGPRRQSGPQMQDRGLPVCSNRAGRRCAMSAPCPPLSSGPGCDGRFCGSPCASHR